SPVGYKTWVLECITEQKIYDKFYDALRAINDPTELRDVTNKLLEKENNSGVIFVRVFEFCYSEKNSLSSSLIEATETTSAGKKKGREDQVSGHSMSK
ncbi:2211_t:CDS:2, partial [Racocetra persica]